MESSFQIIFLIFLIIIFIVNDVDLLSDNHLYYKSARLTKDFLPLNNTNDSIFNDTTTTTTTSTTSTINLLPIDNTTDYINDNITATATTIINQTVNEFNQMIINNNNENRLRWIDSVRHPSFKIPFMPNVAGIPSGFRNPLLMMSTVTTNKLPPTTTTTSTTTTTTTTTTTEATIESLNNFPNQNFLLNSASSLPSSNSYDIGSSSSMIGETGFFNNDIENIRRPNLTRVEHIVAECSDEFMKVVIRFNGTFNGLIYSSGYVQDPKCIYVNGSGRNYYEFFIRLNQCGTLGRQEMYHPTLPSEARRRDHLMWNTLSIQYNSLIEEEFDEHFRLTCEYGSDFWKTVSFPFVNVEINTGSPIMFTINPPQCQMEIRRGFGIAGTRTSGPVTVGDPLTLLIHMKSDRVGFDILVKNCVAHNGAQQRLQLIDANGCVTNEKLISPFRGTYKADNGHQVSLFAYLKAFRFTGSLALYLECDIHMCHNRCPPQRCYWRNLSKRSAKLQRLESEYNTTATPILSESISLVQALEVHHDKDEEMESLSEVTNKDEIKKRNDDLVCLRPIGILSMVLLLTLLLTISFGTTICYWLRIKKLKYLQYNLKYFDKSSLSKSSLSSSLGYRNNQFNHHNHNTSSSIIRSMDGFSDSSSSITLYPYNNGRFCRFS